MAEACFIRVRGIVQGVGFRPFVYRLARSHALHGWVLNAENGVEIHLEGDPSELEKFVHALKTQPPPAANIAEIDIRTLEPQGFSDFTIRESERRDRPTVRISPDLPVCEACLEEMFDPCDRRYRYPYINCTNCGPRYTVILSLPYDRPATTMKDWPLDAYCSHEYHDPGNRRFHAQPVACPQCGPQFQFEDGAATLLGDAAIQSAAQRLREGAIMGVKGLGGYHLACDAANACAVIALRDRKYRKEKPFAVMARNIDVARGLVELSAAGEQLLTSSARPIVLARARRTLEAVAPDTEELGVMLPYAPLHHLLFSAGAPDVLVMTSANRSSEPIAYEDADARERLSGIADALLVGERPIARRVDDSVARAGTFGPVILRRSRGYAPGSVANLPVHRPVLAVGADLKNTLTLVVDGQAFVSQHIGDLDHFQALVAFEETIRDLVSMYDVRWEDLLVIHDAHPQYASSLHALKLACSGRRAVQHHRAHVASVLAERGAWDMQVLGVSFDGTGYGDDGAIWGGEFFAGSIRNGFERVAHLRPALLPGGDAAAQFPVQAAAGFLCQVEGLPDLTEPPFNFPPRYTKALDLAQKAVRTFPTTSMGRLFDTAAALLGFVREITYEGQAAMWLEHQARKSSRSIEAFPFPFASGELDFRPLLSSVVEARLLGTSPSVVARAFQRGIAQGLADAVTSLCQKHKIEVLVLSGGVFQNELLLEDLRDLLKGAPLQVWTNQAVPPNDGGISLGQAALGALHGT
jgi:hydrogenase maturation protein HypF